MYRWCHWRANSLGIPFRFPAQQPFNRLAHELGIDDVEARLQDPRLKDTLRLNTETAVAAGVFGVPSYLAGGEVFWGTDALDFFKAWLADPALLNDPDIARLDALEVGAQRIR